jgi:Zn finger protein HypA/HybF involved in hydrogenase expression
MHEAGIAQQVIEACEIHLRQHGATQATRFGCECAEAAVDFAVAPGKCPSCGAAESFADACALDIRYLEFEGASDAGADAR